MLNGINILAESTTLVQIGVTWGFSPTAFLGIFLFILGLAVVWVMITEHEHSVIGWIAFIVFTAVCVIGWHNKPVYQEVPTYKATIEDTVSLNQFNKRYVVLNKEGKIYTFRERTETELYK